MFNRFQEWEIDTSYRTNFCELSLGTAPFWDVWFSGFRPSLQELALLADATWPIRWAPPKWSSAIKFTIKKTLTKKRWGMMRVWFLFIHPGLAFQNTAWTFDSSRSACTVELPASGLLNNWSADKERWNTSFSGLFPDLLWILVPWRLRVKTYPWSCFPHLFPVRTSASPSDPSGCLPFSTEAEGMSRFGEALQSELNGTDSHLAGVAVEALSTEVTGTAETDRKLDITIL